MVETTRTVVIAGREFALRPSEVERDLEHVLPEPVKDHYAVISRRQYPPKQVVAVVTGLNRAEFTSHHARRILAGLGFALGRRRSAEHGVRAASGNGGSGAGGGPPSGRQGVKTRPSAETLEPFVGQWVATKGAEVLVAAVDPQAVVGWLAKHRQRADSMFRVPRDEFEASGVAPV